MVNKKMGFTLVEVLGAIVILGLIFLLAIPSIVNQVKKSSGDIDKATQNLIFNSTRMFIDKNSNEYPITNTNVYCISLQTLVNSGDLVNNLTDVISGKKIDLNQVVKIEIENEANIDYNVVKENQCVQVIYKPFICGEDLVDTRDSKTYKTVKIGEQCFMAENLRYTGNGCLSKTWDGSAPHDACQTHTTGWGEEVLYQWGAAMNGSATEKSQGLCPEGWYIPTDGEWTTLTNYVGASAGTKLKSSINWDGTDNYRFNALPAGGRGTSAALNDVGSGGGWWSSSPSGPNAWDRYMSSGSFDVYRYTSSQAGGTSVRCVSEQ